MRFTLYYLNSITGVHNGKLSIQNLLKLNPRKNFPIIKPVFAVNSKKVILQKIAE